MSDREDIVHLLNQYAFRIDRGDIAGWAALFENGELVIEGERSYVGQAGLMEIGQGVILYQDGTPRTKHVISNVDLYVEAAAREAGCQCYVMVFQCIPDRFFQPVWAGEYSFDFEKQGGWHIRRLTIRYPLLGDSRWHLGAAETPKQVG